MCIEQIMNHLNATTFSAIAAIGSCCAAWLNFKLAYQKERRNQASKIAAWISGIAKDESDDVVVTIANNSDLPMYDVFVIGYMSQQEIEDVPEYKAVLYKDLIPPNSEGETRLYRMKNLGNDIGGKHMVVALFFRDSNGKCWLRDHTGIFKEHDKYLIFLDKKGVFGPYSQYVAREYESPIVMRRRKSSFDNEP